MKEEKINREKSHWTQDSKWKQQERCNVSCIFTVQEKVGLGENVDERVTHRNKEERRKERKKERRLQRQNSIKVSSDVPKN